MVDQVQPLHPVPAPFAAVLVVGNLAGWRRMGRTMPDLPGFHFAALSDVTAELMQAVAPALVLSALMGEDYDVIELARRLTVLGFAGQYRALTSGLPNPGLVVAEVRNAAPGIDFDLLDVQAGLLRRR